MTDNLPAAPPTKAATKAKHRSAPHLVTGRLREACLLMIFGDEGGNPLEYDAAAKAVGLTVRGMRKAMDKAHVRAFLRQQRAILVASFAATNPLHIARMRAESQNAMVKLQASRLIEELAGEVAATDGRQPRSPGVTIIIAAPISPPVARVGTTIIAPHQLIEAPKEGG